jgi:hypothetical protein
MFARILLVFFQRSVLIGRNFSSEMGKKKKRDQSDFFIVTLSLKNLKKKSFHQKNIQNQLKMKNQEIELEKKPVQDERSFWENICEFRQKEKRAREIRIFNAMELRDIKICILQIFPAELVFSSRASFF